MNYKKKSEMLKALGHPVRLRMVEGLLRHECNVSKIVKNLKLPQSTVSQHLGILKNAGVLVPQKQGVETCYRVVDQDVEKIINIFKQT
ncbi:MAG: metalloregulator ArsR/SmtB family transcription factor [Candidatus Aceula meridiana]|nr:metalloregulator ArsR/SmtB family transcription factor [Candidatus Aceula meridiana]